MGIPGLWTLLSNHGEKCIYPPSHVSPTHVGRCGSSPLAQPGPDVGGATLAIIDGPNFVHAAYSRVVRRQRQRAELEGLDVLPSYEAVRHELLSWLGSLEYCGFQVYRIFFDGRLPQDKVPTRRQRIQTQIQGSGSLRSACPGDRVTPSAVRKYMQWMTITPLLVPFAIDCLRASKFAPNVFVMPEEAETLCAWLVKQEGGVVFSDDSDMLLFEMGNDAAIIRLQDIQNDEYSLDAKLVTQRYVPAQIAAGLKLCDLRSLAFALEEDPHRSLLQCQRRALDLERGVANSTEQQDAYRRFAHHYSSAMSGATESNKLWSRNSRYLDPRISEWLYNFVATPPDNAIVTCSSMYFLPLTEDATRRSAWRVGADIRRLGYSIFKPSGIAAVGREARQFTTIEHYRRGSMLMPSTVEHYHDAESLIAAHGLVLFITDLKHLVKTYGFSLAVRWRTAAAIILLQDLSGQDMALPSRSDILQLIKGGYISESWRFLHLSAQFEAAIYSLRILKQLVDLRAAEAVPGPAKRVDGVRQELKLLMTDFPVLGTLFPSTPDCLEGEDLTTFLLEACKIGQVGRALSPDVEKGTTKRREPNSVGSRPKKTERKPALVKRRGPVPLGGNANPFGALADNYCDETEE